MPANEEEIFTTWISDQSDDNVSVMVLCGELDASTAPDFIASMRPVLDRDKDVVMDVHLLSYIDSTGVAAVLSAKNAQDQKGRKMCLVGCHGLMTKILHTMQIDRQIECYEDLDVAVAKMKSDGCQCAGT